MFYVALAVTAGICIGFGVIHLFIGYRRREHRSQYLLFAVFSLAYGGAVVTAIGLYSADSILDWVTASKLNGPFVVVALVALLWYVASYCGVRHRRFLLGLSCVFLLVLLANSTRAFGLASSVDELTQVHLPWGETVAAAVIGESGWSQLFYVAELTTFVFILYACARQYRRGERREALMLAAGMMFIAAALVFDAAVEAGAVTFVMLSDFAFLPLAVIVALQMSNEVIRTEESLTLYRGDLEALVAERTSELEEVAEQLRLQVAERQKAEAALQLRVRRLRALREISGSLVSCETLSEGLSAAAATMTGLYDAEYVHILTPNLDVDGSLVVVGISSRGVEIGPTEVDVELDRLPVTANVMAGGNSQAMYDVQSLDLPDVVQSFVRDNLVSGLLLVPLSTCGSPPGLLAIAVEDPGRKFTSDEISLAETVAGDIGLAIENEQLQRSARLAAAFEERGRIARDLHDAVTQTIYSAVLVAEALPSIFERNPDEAKNRLVLLRQLARGALGEMRTLLFELRPSAIGEAQVDTMLRQLGDTLTVRSRIQLHLETETEGDLPADVKVALYRIAQEAFSNIAKHSEADEAAVILRHGSDWATLTIRDNGRGPDAADLASKGMGLGIMRERADEIGATFEVASSGDGGTIVSVRWPADTRVRP